MFDSRGNVPLGHDGFRRRRRRRATGRVVSSAVAVCCFIALIAAAAYILEPFPHIGTRVATTAGPVETPYTPSAVEEWEREAEAAVELALLASPGVRDASRSLEERALVVGRGDTMMHLFLRAGVPRSQAAAAIDAMRPVYNPRRIVPGQKLTVTYLAGDPALDDRGIQLRKAKLATGPTSAICRRAPGKRIRGPQGRPANRDPPCPGRRRNLVLAVPRGGEGGIAVAGPAPARSGVQLGRRLSTRDPRRRQFRRGLGNPLHPGRHIRGPRRDALRRAHPARQDSAPLPLRGSPRNRLFRQERGRGA